MDGNWRTRKTVFALIKNVNRFDELTLIVLLFYEPHTSTKTSLWSIGNNKRFLDFCATSIQMRRDEIIDVIPSDGSDVTHEILSA